jgi:hypothetical protein
MRLNFSFKHVLFIFGIGLLITSCGDEGPGIPVLTDPSLTLAAGTGLITGDATVKPNEEFKVNIKGSKAKGDLKILTIQEAGTNVPLARINFVSGLSGGANPLTFSGALASAFDIVVSIKAHSTIGLKSYTFILEDIDGRKSTKTIAITTSGTPPSVDIMSAATLNTEVDKLYAFTIKTTKGTSPLKEVEVLINGVRATDLARLEYGDPTSKVFTANPNPIPASDKDGATTKIIVRAPMTTGVFKYTFKFIDESGLFTSKEVTLNNSELKTLEGVLLNQSGVTGTGGLDLDNGKGTGSADLESEIRDEGNASTGIWRQQISGINGAEVRYVVKGTNFDFNRFTLKADVISAFLNGKIFTEKIGTRNVSDKIVDGDALVARKDNKYYLFVIKKVSPTANDNLDSYTIDIKY